MSANSGENEAHRTQEGHLMDFQSLQAKHLYAFIHSTSMKHLCGPRAEDFLRILTCSCFA